jgi:hypothetical protein
VLVTIQETGERFGIVTRVARQLSIATESLRAQGREEDVMAATSSGVPLHIVRRRGRSIAITVLMSIVPGIFWNSSSG